jgi:hypothetical protein
VALEYELSLDGQADKVVEVDEPVEVGDALMLGDQVWLVLRESKRAAVRSRARFECRRALRLRHQAQELIEYAEELQLQFIEARELRSE